MTSRLLRACLPVIAVIVLAAGPTLPALAQTGEPSPIEVSLVAPAQAGPGELIDVAIQYKVVDLNANALLNYNLSGPARIWTRSPEPPNPIVNTWGPKFEPIEGTITVQVQVNEGTDGQTLRHEVEVSWGTKTVRYGAETQIKFVPPTPTPPPTPRPRPSATATPVPLTPAPSSAQLVSAAFVSVGAGPTPLTSIEGKQPIGLAVQYTSSGDLANAVLRVRFIPDIVALEGFERQGATLVTTLSSLPSAAQNTAVPGSPFSGRILGYPEGGDRFLLEAVIELELDPSSLPAELIQVRAAPVEVWQKSMLDLTAHTDSATVRGGGNIIVHVRLANKGPVQIEGIELRLEGLPTGFVVTPAEQRLERVPVGSEIQERLFTVRVPEGYSGMIQLSAAATYGDGVVSSAPVDVTVASPTPLAVQAAADRTAVRAGNSVYVDASVRNDGVLAAHQVAVRLIDVTGNLGVLLQSIGDVAPGEQHDLVFVVQIPPEFPADVQSSLVVQAICEDAAVSESEPVPLMIACVPRLETSAQGPAARVRAGQSVELLALVRNVGQCPARDISLTLEGLPSTIDSPAPERIAFLGPGEARYAGFAIAVPDRHPQGDLAFQVQASDQLGSTTSSPPVTLTIGGTPLWFTILFGLLALLAIGATVFGLTSYFHSAASR